MRRPSGAPPSSDSWYAAPGPTERLLPAGRRGRVLARLAMDAREGSELLRNQLFEGAVCDIHMPETNGIELLRQMKRHAPSLEVLMMTGDATVPTTRETLKLGAFDYLPKPLDMDELHHL